MAKKRKPTWMAALLIVSVIPALALLKTTVFSNNRNILGADNSTKYDIVVDLGEGGRFESGDFSKMPNGKWISKYLPGKEPVTLPKPVKDGYIFEGWLTEGSSTPKPDYVIPPWSRENINLTAKWQVAESVLLSGSKFNAKIQSLPGFTNVTEIRFIKAPPKPDGIDLSEAQNGAIRGFIESNVLNIVSDGQIYSNPDSSNMFHGLRKVTNIIFDNFDTSKVTDMHWMFNNCSELTSLNISNFNMSKVTDVHYMFSNCSNLITLDLSKWNTTLITNMSYMFNNCSNLTNLNLLDWNTSKVTDMSSMFENCSRLSRFRINNWNTGQVTNMSNMFKECNRITTLNGIDKWNMSRVTDTTGMFNGCLILSGELTINNLNIKQYNNMFTRCSSDINAKFIVKYKDAATKELARKMVATKNPDDHVYLYEEPKAVLMSGRDFNYALSKISGFDYVKEVKFVKGKPRSGVNVAIEGEAIASIDGEVLTIASEQKICANPDSSYMFKSFGTFNYSGANLRIDKITFNNFDTSLVTNMRSMFEDCPKLISLDLRSFDTSQVTDMSRMFFFCRDITDINVSSFNTTNVTNMCSMFHMCTRITQLDLGSFNTVNVTDMSNMFQGDQYLSSLDISSFRTPNVRNMSYMFSACADLRHIDISNFDTRNTTDMTYMFNLCENISCEFTVMNPNCNVSGAFSGIDSLDPVSVTINYTRGCESLVDKMIKSALVGARIKKGNEVPMPIAMEVRESQLKANTQLPFDTESSKINVPVNLTLNNGTAAQYPKQVFTVQNNIMPQLSIPELNPRYAGQFGGYYYDQQFTKPVKAGDIITKDLTIYARW